MGMSVGGGESEYNTTINVVPLVDIMLVLISIFIITLPVMTHAVKIDLPRADPNQVPPPPTQAISIEVKYDGQVAWDGNIVTPTELRQYITSASKQDPQPDVHVQVDRRAKYDAAAAVLFAVQRGGLKRIGFVADENGGI